MVVCAYALVPQERVVTRDGSGSRTAKTYNTRDSPVVTHLSTGLALTGLSRGERTGSRIFLWVWSYVMVRSGISIQEHAGLAMTWHTPSVLHRGQKYHKAPPYSGKTVLATIPRCQQRFVPKIILVLFSAD
ncbi:hypothetical protein BT67DRAFT_193538 [Trichocladium antarcticum]|uniref:Uncharacterized protein n=1 Tax=Trichocladium antarcticum TaxID=1450529 RepID=A0AAN6ZGD8_9PEZI|nr:hypothetical protein BT67DRAFT_193538 [Trichocladium antarcticum]